MNIQKFTQKSIDAVNQLEKVASDFGNQEIEQEHLLYALLHQDQSLIAQLVSKMGIDERLFGQAYVGQYLNKALLGAEDEAKKMGDSYVAVEHLFLSIFDFASPSIRAFFQKENVTREKFLQALSTVRGNQVVNTDTPEDTYDALAKYGTELVAKAKQQKMDPIIGRDDEIRNVIRILSRKTKNNPVLIGEPGVGKTAVVEGLAERIAREDVPDSLKSLRNG